MHATRSWIAGADASDTDFPAQNLPLCVFRPRGAGGAFHIGAGIGDFILDLASCVQEKLLAALDADIRAACEADRLNALFALGRPAMRALRSALLEIVDERFAMRSRASACLVAQADVEFDVPAHVGDYTDFLSSYHHAFNVGRLFRPDEPVLPNFHALPIAYHGRSSSLVVSGEPVYRPSGQYRAGHGASEILFGPTRRLDLELELGAYIAGGNARGRPVALAQADDLVAGLCLLNDWSARDIQGWESQPLGPFLGKNFATSVSPWVVTLDALEPYRTAAAAHRQGDARLQPYLRPASEDAATTFPIHVQASIGTRRMREAGLAEEVISRALFSRDSTWTFAQMIAHHTVNGCNLRAGDLLGSGTLSGPHAGSEGSLLELTRGGSAPLRLANGETRTFLEDGDEIVLSAHCHAPGLPRLGFGECRARIHAALEPAPA